MIDFMVFGLPRSGTAWIANLLTTDNSLCLHESLIDFTLSELNDIKHDGLFGISETSAVFLPEAIKHPCKKLIIHRPVFEINRSLEDLDFPSISDGQDSLLSLIEGYKINYNDLFNFEAMSLAYRFLLDKDLSQKRHAMLCKMNIQNQYAIDYVKRMF